MQYRTIENQIITENCNACNLYNCEISNDLVLEKCNLYNCTFNGHSVLKLSNAVGCVNVELCELEKSNVIESEEINED